MQWVDPDGSGRSIRSLHSSVPLIPIALASVICALFSMHDVAPQARLGFRIRSVPVFRFAFPSFLCGAGHGGVRRWPRAGGRGCRPGRRCAVARRARSFDSGQSLRNSLWVHHPTPARACRRSARRESGNEIQKINHIYIAFAFTLSVQYNSVQRSTTAVGVAWGRDVYNTQ